MLNTALAGASSFRNSQKVYKDMSLGSKHLKKREKKRVGTTK